MKSILLKIAFWLLSFLSHALLVAHKNQLFGKFNLSDEKFQKTDLAKFFIFSELNHTV